MILSVEEFIEMGFKVSSSEATKLAIKEAEFFYIKDKLTDKIYAQFDTERSTELDILMDGGYLDDKYFAGLKFAIAHIAFAFLLRQDLASVRYGTVTKSEDNSTPAGQEHLYSVARYNQTIGDAALRDICAYFDIEWKTTNNFFNEFGL